MSLFEDRPHAGQLLAEALTAYEDRADVVVLGLPRGGVPVAAEVATALHAPLDVLIVRKLGVPGHEELAMGAIASGGSLVLNHDVIEHLDITPVEIETKVAQETKELRRRERVYRQSRDPIDVAGKEVVVVDDGLATGATMLAAVRLLRQRGARRIVVAVPVAPVEAVEKLSIESDELICLHTPRPFWGVGPWYEHFEQTTDAEVRSLLAHATAGTVPSTHRTRESHQWTEHS